ncbi:MAG: hypothetical protein PHF33_09785, partial [Candidatus Delongbacteria bacterium]|nr:hypothetical protein [Candidatus Delongbacteria bacterium]
WESTDALHCRTRGVIDKEMLHIYHIADPSDRSSSESYTISANMVSYGGNTITSAVLYYKVDTGNWNSIPMALSKAQYTATIPAQAAGSEVSYYIHAEDNSGRSENHPFIGSADPHKFNIIQGETLQSPGNIRTNISGSNIEIEWDAVIGASSYVVYSSDDPNGTFTYTATTTLLKYITPYSSAKKFYYVVAKN